MNDDNYIEELYKSFVDALENGSPLDEFERDELVEIYDYASDIHDGYVQFKVLAEAHHRFDGDSEISERLAYFFYDLGDNAAAMKVLEGLSTDSFLKSLLCIAIVPMSQEEQRRRVDELISVQQKGSLGDEEVIRLVEIGHHLLSIDWLKERYTTIKQCAEYPDTAMNEIANMAEIDGDKEFAIMALEDMTSDYPFNVDSWLALSDLYSERENFSEAEQALGFAHAIDPKHYATRTRLLSIKLAGGVPLQQLIKMSDGLIEEFPDNASLYVLRAYVYFMRGDISSAIEVLSHARRKFPESHEILSAFLSLSSEASLPCPEIKAIEKEMKTDECHLWINDFQTQKDSGRTEAATQLAYLLTMHADLRFLSDRVVVSLLTTLYSAKRYEYVVEGIERLEADGLEVQPVSEITLLRALSLKRLGLTDDLNRLLGNVVGREFRHDDHDLCPHLQDVGIAYYLMQLRRSMADNDIDESCYDPFIAYR